MLWSGFCDDHTNCFIFIFQTVLIKGENFRQLSGWPQNPSDMLNSVLFCVLLPHMHLLWKLYLSDLQSCSITKHWVWVAIMVEDKSTYIYIYQDSSQTSVTVDQSRHDGKRKNKIKWLTSNFHPYIKWQWELNSMFVYVSLSECIPRWSERLDVSCSVSHGKRYGWTPNHTLKLTHKMYR